MSAADTGVRPAEPSDVAGIADAQGRVWREAYGQLLPPAALRAFETADAEERWREAVQSPPTPRHRVLVAVDDGRLAGFVAFGPASDTDVDPAHVAEVFALCVLPERQGAGHGSRLLAATVDILRTDGFTTAVTWLLDTDSGMSSFLQLCGWAPDGTTRGLDVGGEIVHQMRLHTAL